MRADVLDDDFVISFQLVDLYGNAPCPAVQQQHPVLAARFGQCPGVAEQIRQESEWVGFSLPFHLTVPVHLIERGIFDVERLFDHRRGDGVAAVAYPYQQGFGDGEGERDVERKLRTLAAFASDFDAAAQTRNLTFDHIHANATAGNLRDLACGGEARQQDQLRQLGIVRRFVLANEAGFDGARTDAFKVQASAVIGQADDDFIAFLPEG